MLANAGVNINDSVQVRNYLNSYYNRNYSYAAYSQVLSGCANQTLNYVLALPGVEAEEAKEGYRFGFNAGSEKDDEIFIGAYTAEYWEYDSRLGRRWNVDPLTYAWQSSYVVLNNSPHRYRANPFAWSKGFRFSNLFSFKIKTILVVLMKNQCLETINFIILKVYIL